jgi:NAD(P)-dependent dehydrogenase (short-subunit alcohol dehydrogenase family)
MAILGCDLIHDSGNVTDRTFLYPANGYLQNQIKFLQFLDFRTAEGISIILNASIAAYKGADALSVYSATKAAVRSFARTWTVDLKQRKVRVNAISPGPIDTPMSSGADEQLMTSVISTVPMGRMGSPDEIAKAVSFLASDDSSYVAGIELFVDGGMAQISVSDLLYR